MRSKYQIFVLILLFLGTSLNLYQCAGKRIQSQLDSLLPSVKTYDYGENREQLTKIEDLVRQAQPKAADRKTVENGLVGVLNSGATLPGKQFICRQLSLIGSSASVPVLAQMVTNDSTSDMARYALERIPDPAAGAALTEALNSSQGMVKVGIINSLGRRKEERAISALAGLLSSSNTEIAEAAATALGNIGSTQAAENLWNAAPNTAGPVHSRVVEGYLVCADQAFASGDSAGAQSMYQNVYVTDEPTIIKEAALTGIVKTSGQSAGEVILAALQERDTAMHPVALSMLAEVPGVENLDKIVALLPTLTPTGQVQMLTALGLRGDPSVRDSVIQVVDSSNLPVQIAALTALKTLGNASTVNLLAREAASGPAEKREAARQSLYLLRGDQVDQTILSSIKQATPAVKVELIRSADQRSTPNAAQTILGTATDPNAAVRMASIQVLGDIATPENIPALLDLLVNAGADNERSALQKSVVSVANKIPDRKNRGDQILDRLDSVQNVTARASLLEVLGNIGDPDAVPVIQNALQSNNSSLQTAAIRAFAAWPTPDPADQLLKVAGSATSSRQQVLALRGYIRLVGLPSDRSADETVQMYQKAMGLARNANEQRLVLSGLEGVQSVSALNAAGEYLDNPDLRREAEVAVVRIARRISDDHPAEVRQMLQKVLQVTQNESIRNNAQRMLDDLQK